MKRETVKSYILSILIILSLVLSWYIWTLKPKYETIEENKVIQDVQIGKRKSINEIIFPKQVIIHKNQQHFAITEHEPIIQFTQQFSDWELKHFEKVSNLEDQESFLKFVHGNEKIETIFPSMISIKSFKDNFNKVDLDDYHFNFDRIIVSAYSKSTQYSRIYFVNYSKQEIYQADAYNVNINNIRRNLYFVAEKYQSHFPYYINKNHTVFLPQSMTKMYSMTFLTEETDQELFKNALFIDPKFVKKNTAKGLESFTDGTRLLKVNYNLGNIEYVNPVNAESNNKDDTESLYQSISFINDHGGFNDNFTVYGYDQHNKTSIFRLNYNNIPIFSKSNFSSIKLKWGNDEAVNYSHPLFRLSFPIEREKKAVDLLSGYDLVTKIKADRNINKDRIEDVMIGYELFLNVAVGNVARINPIWLIKYEGSWRKYEVDSTSSQGGYFIGLE